MFPRICGGASDMARRTKDEALETRERILDAAERVFQQKGVSRTSLGEVAAAAGVTRGAIYWHFENKAELFDAMILRVCAPFDNLCAGPEILVGKPDPLAFVRDMSLQFLQRMASDRHYRQVFEIAWHKCEYVDEMAAIRDKHLEVGSRYLDVLETALRDAQAKGRVRADIDPRQAAVGLRALVDGLAINWTLDPTGFPLADMAAGIIDSYLAGLGARFAAAHSAV
jgi:TetR/AcrR family acrAB operon transcriptional repressor